MSAKLAVIIGDYSNGWSDAWVVQVPIEGTKQADLAKDRKVVLARMNEAALDIAEFIQHNEKINPVPEDEPCCKDFADWYKTNETAFFCGKCGKKITAERAEKFKRML